MKMHLVLDSKEIYVYKYMYVQTYIGLLTVLWNVDGSFRSQAAPEWEGPTGYMKQSRKTARLFLIERQCLQTLKGQSKSRNERPFNNINCLNNGEPDKLRLKKQLEISAYFYK